MPACKDCINCHKKQSKPESEIEDLESANSPFSSSPTQRQAKHRIHGANKASVRKIPLDMEGEVGFLEEDRLIDSGSEGDSGNQKHASKVGEYHHGNKK